MPSPLTSPASIAETPKSPSARMAGQAEAVAAVEARQRKRGRPAPASAEDDIGLAGKASPAGIGPERTDDDVVEAVAVYVTGARHEAAAAVGDGDAVEAEAVAAVEAGQGDVGGKASRLAEDDVAFPRIGPAAGIAPATADR